MSLGNKSLCNVLEKYGIVQFEENYDSWCFRVLSMLDRYDLKDRVEELLADSPTKKVIKNAKRSLFSVFRTIISNS